MKDQISQEFHRECTKCWPLKESELRKYQGKFKILKSFIENVLSVDLWKIPHFETISMKDQTSQSSIENVISVYLWKIPHSENIDIRPNF